MVDICLIPEVNFDVPALMAHARLLLQQKGHIVVRACLCVILIPCSMQFTMAWRSKHVIFEAIRLFVDIHPSCCLAVIQRESYHIFKYTCRCNTWTHAGVCC